METKKDYVELTTSNPKEMVGKYLAKAATKTWKEDIHDEETDEIITIERNEVLFEKGLFIGGDVLPKIMFSIQAGELEEVTVSNQNRPGMEVSDKTYMQMYSATISISSGKVKKQNILLFATSINHAMECMRDYAELTVDGMYEILSIRTYENMLFLKQDEPGVDKNGEPNKLMCTIVEVNAIYNDPDAIDDDSEVSYPTTFFVQAVSADYAWRMVIAYLAEPRDGQHLIYSRSEVEKIKPVPVSNVVPHEFCEAYKNEL